jgi:hypothetical protein
VIGVVATLDDDQFPCSGEAVSDACTTTYQDSYTCSSNVDHYTNGADLDNQVRNAAEVYSEGGGACKAEDPVFDGLYIEDIALEAEALLDAYDFDAVGDFLAEKGKKSDDYVRALLLADLLDQYNNGAFCGDFAD